LEVEEGAGLAVVEAAAGVGVEEVEDMTCSRGERSDQLVGDGGASGTYTDGYQALSLLLDAREEKEKVRGNEGRGLTVAKEGKV
jgi:hypothetical protein